MTVFIVTRGEYSDYTILGVFSSEEKAKKFAVEVKKDWSSDVEIEPWELDERVNETLQTVFQVKLSKNGTELLNNNFETLGTQESLQFSGVEERKNDIVIFVGKSIKSRDHAHKLAVEARQKWLAKNTLSSLKDPNTR